MQIKKTAASILVYTMLLSLSSFVGQAAPVSAASIPVQNNPTDPLVITPETPPTVPVGSTYKFSVSGASGAVTWSLASGSVGTIDQTGTYHAPSSIAAEDSLNGCELLPDDDILNTPIQTLPVDPISTNYMQNIVGMPQPTSELYYTVGHDHNSIDNTTPSGNYISSVNSLNNGTYQVPVWPNLQKQQGALISQSPDVGDQHYWMINHQTCHIGEMYDIMTPGEFPDGLTAPDNMVDGTQYDSTSYNLPPGSSDSASGLPVFPLTLRLSDLRSGAINHPLYLTMENSYMNRGWVWPAVATNYAGPDNNPTLPHFGERIRLKASKNITSYTSACTATCQQYVQELVTQMKDYGYLITDGGFNWNVSAENDMTEDPNAMQAMAEIGNDFNVASNPSDPNNAIRSNFELVDQSSLEQSVAANFSAGTTTGNINHYFGNTERNIAGTNSITCKTSNGTVITPSNTTIGNETDTLTFSPALSAAVTCTDYNDHSGLTNLNNGYVMPSNAARIIATDASGNFATMAANVEPVTVGTQYEDIQIQSGVPTPLSAWVNGTSNQGVVWTMSPSLGTLSNSVFTPSTVTVPTKTTLTATSVADPSSKTTIGVTVIPAGSIYMMAGPVTQYGTPPQDSQGDYGPDSNGNMWWNGDGWSHGGVYTGGDVGWNNQVVQTQSKITNAIPYDRMNSMDGGDIVYRFQVPNGNYNIGFSFTKFWPTDSNPPYMEADLEVNGKIVDNYSETGEPQYQVDVVNVPTQTVTNNTLEIALRKPLGYYLTNPSATYDDVYLSSLSIVPSGGSPAKDTTPPVVSMTAPLVGATISGTIALTANATDNVGVAKVQFAVDGTNVGSSVTTVPYTYSLNTATLTNGNHTFTAVATDTSGNVTTSTPVTITVSNTSGNGGANVPPTVSITSPLANATVQCTVPVTATATAAAGATIASVRFAVDGTNIGGPITNAPYTYQFDSSKLIFNHTLTATAIDNFGNTATSASVPINIQNSIWTSCPASSAPPTISVIAPVAGATLSGSVDLSASAAAANTTDTAGTSDTTGTTIANVQFAVDGTNIGTPITAAPYTYSLDTTTLANGSHTITAITTDSAGQTANSAAVPIIVSNESVNPVCISNTPESGVVYPAKVQIGQVVKFQGALTAYIVAGDGLHGFTEFAGYKSYMSSTAQRIIFLKVNDTGVTISAVSAEQFIINQQQCTDSSTAPVTVTPVAMTSPTAPSDMTPVSTPVPKPVSTTPSSTVFVPNPTSQTTTYASGTLVNDNGTIYLIRGSQKIAFTGIAAFTSLGYSLSNVINGNTGGYALSSYQVSTATAGNHPRGAWIKTSNSPTVYYVSANGYVPVSSYQTFTQNGGTTTQILPATSQESKAIASQPAIPVMVVNDSRIIK